MGRYKHKILRLTGLTFLAALFLFSLLPRTAFADMQLDLFLSAGVEYNDNVDLLPDESVLEADIAERITDDDARRAALEALNEFSRDDVIYTVSPQIGFAWSERDDSLSFSYQPQYRDYGEDFRGEEWIHRLDAGLQWRRLEPFRLSVTDTLDVTPRDLVTPEADLRTQVQHNSLTVRPSLYWDVSPTTSFEVAYILERDDYNDDSPLDTIEDNSLRHLGELQVFHRWSPRSDSWLRVTGGTAEHDFSEDYDFLEGGVGGLHLLSRRTELSWGAVAHNRSYDISGDELDVLGNVTLSWQHHEAGRLDFTVNHGIDDRFDGESVNSSRVEISEEWIFPRGSSLLLGAYYEYRDYRVQDRTDDVWGPYANFLYAATDWLSFTFEGDYRISKIDEAIPAATGGAGNLFFDDSSDEQFARLRAAVLLSPWTFLSVETGWEYLDNSADEPIDEYSRHLVFVEAQGTFSALSR